MTALQRAYQEQRAKGRGHDLVLEALRVKFDLDVPSIARALGRAAAEEQRRRKREPA